MSDDDKRRLGSKYELMRKLKQDELERLSTSADPFPRKLQGRPYTDYERAIIMDEVFERLRLGESMHLICMDAHMPCRETVFGWVRGDAELGRAYDAIAIPRAMALFELALWEVQRARDRESMYIAEKRANLYLKAAALLNPKLYSDKTHSSLAKSIGTSAPVAITLNIGGSMGEATRELVVVQPTHDTHE